MYHYCMLGSIVCNDDGVEDRNELHERCDYGTWSGTSHEYQSTQQSRGRNCQCNDAAVTRRDTVERIMSTAARLQELEELGTSVPAK